MTHNGKHTDPNRIGPVVDRRTLLQGAVGATALFGLSTSASADGTAEVIVHAEETEPDALPFDADTVDELKATAAQSQEPIVEYVEDRDGVELLNQFWLSNSLLVEVDTDEVELEELTLQEGVSRVHDNFVYEIPQPAEDATSADDDDVTYGLDGINAPDVWETFDAKGEGARISVIDTGVDPDHPDIEIEDENFAEFDADGNEVEDAETRDSGYHGTHVSGTVMGAQDPEGDVPSYGVAPEATLLHGLGLPGGSGTFAQIIGAMEWSVENDADAINLSLGAPGYFGEVIEPIRNAEAAGTMVVASSGNDGEGTSSNPGNVFEAVAVGASDENEEIADFSSGEIIDTEEAWGPLAPDDWPDEYVIPDVSAPGVDVLSAIPEDESVPFTGCGTGDIYCEVSGTSMAAPHTAGLVALMHSAAADIDDEFEVDQFKAGFKTTTVKPEDAPEEQDTRYGRGIVDALQATSRVAANSGIEGTVFDVEADTDDPIEGASVDLEGFPVRTDEDGEYRLRALEGKYDVTADAFGFETLTAEDVDVSEDEFTTLDFDLNRELAAAVVDGQPEGLEAGNSFDVVVQVANLKRLTIEQRGTYQGEAWLEVDGEEVEFGDPIEFDDPVTDTVTVTFTSGDDGLGDLELEHTFEWPDRDQTIQVTTGPTAVFEEPVPIAVVDREEGVFGGDIVAVLDQRLHPRYEVERLDASEAVGAAEGDTYEAYVVQNLGEEEYDRVEEFAEETAPSEVGVLWLDQFGLESNGISQLSEATDDPGATFDWAEQFFFFPPSVFYHVEDEHPVWEGVGDVDDAVRLSTPLPIFDIGGFHTYFESYDGRVAGETVGGVSTSTSGFFANDAVAVDEIRSTVLAASLGFEAVVTRQEFEEEAEEILANAAAVAAETPPVRDVSLPDDRADPGDDIEWVFEVDDLVELELGLADPLLVDDDDFTLLVDGVEAAFDEPVEFDEPVDEEVTITLETTADTIGRFSLDTRFVTLDRVGEEVTTAVTFRPISVYELPLEVPQDLEDLQDAVTLVAPGEEIVVDEGLYEVDAPDAPAIQVGLSVDTPDITIRAAEDTRPSVIHERDLPAPRIINVSADGVTIDGIEANLIDGEVDEKNSIGSGMRINADGVTVRDVDAAGTFGIQFEGGISDIHVEDCEAIETVIGVGTDSGAFGDVTDTTITNVTVTDRPDFTFRSPIVVDSGASRVEVTDCEILIEDGEEGILLEGPFGGGEDCLVANNEILGDGIEDEPFIGFNSGIMVDEVEAVVEDNTIEDTYTGIQVSDFGFGDEDVVIRNNEIRVNGVGYGQNGDRVTLEHNVIEADIGLNLEGGFFGLDADAVLAQYNDLSETELPFAGEASTGFGAPEPAIFDCRQNYFGDRDYDETIADGDIEYDPFLTEPPQEIDFSQPIEIGTDLYLSPGGTYGLGIPGPTDLTIWDVLDVEEGGGHNAFDGKVYRWNENRSGGPGRGQDDGGDWQRVTGRGSLSDQDSLVGFKVEPDEGVRAVIDFQYRRGSPPGRRDDDLGRIEVQEGTNIVCAPAYGDGELFDEGTAEIESVEPKELGSPGSQMGAEKAPDAEKKPFSAYYVEISEAGTIECDLDSYDPVMDDLYEAFGLDPEIHPAPGASGMGTSSIGVTIEDVIEATEDDVESEAVTTLSGHRLVNEVDFESDPEATVEGLGDVAETLVGEAPSGDRDLVEEAIRDAVASVIASHFDASVVEDPDSEPEPAADIVAVESEDGAVADD